jgi:hypothetical protein
MADNLPTYDTLEKMMGGGLATHFMLNQMDQTKASLAEKFKKDQLDTQHRQGEVRAQELTNLFAEQENPLKLDGLRSTNRTAAAGATSAESKARVDLGTEQFKLNDAQRNELAKLSEHELKMAEMEAWKMMQSPNPEHRAAAKNFLEGTQAYTKAKYDSDLIANREAPLEAGRNARNAADIASREKIARLAAEKAAAGRTKAVETLQTRLLKAKNSKEKAEILESGYYDAVAAGDTDLANQLKARALEARARAMEDKPPAKDEVVIPGLDVKPKPGVTAPIAGSGKTTGPTVEQMRAALRNNLK